MSRSLLVAFITSGLLLFQNCSKTNFSPEAPAQVGITESASEEPPQEVEQKTSCDIEYIDETGAPKTLKVEHGKYTAMMSTKNGNKCDKIELRYCNYGKLDGSFNKRFCTLEESVRYNPSQQSCTYAGKTYKHGDHIVLFKNARPNVGEACQSQVRICNNGVITGETNFAHQSCIPSSASTDGSMCSSNGLEIPDGSKILGFTKELVANSNYNLAMAGCANTQLSLPANGQFFLASRELTGYEASPNTLVFSQSANQKNFSFDFSGQEGAGLCYLEVQLATGVWSRLPTPSQFSCDKLIIAMTASLPDQLGNDFWKMGSRKLRIVNESSSIQTEAERLLKCEVKSGSTMPTPSVDEDCDGNFDNQANGQYR